MKAYSEDLRIKIVDAVNRRGMDNCQAARTFDVSLSTVKRYITRSRNGLSLSPGKAPGRTPKMGERTNKLLEEDVKERPTATLQHHSEYLRAVAGVEVSRSVVCPASLGSELPAKRGTICHGARRIPKDGLAGDGGRGRVI